MFISDSYRPENVNERTSKSVSSSMASRGKNALTLHISIKNNQKFNMAGCINFYFQQHCMVLTDV